MKTWSHCLTASQSNATISNERMRERERDAQQQQQQRYLIYNKIHAYNTYTSTVSITIFFFYSKLDWLEGVFDGMHHIIEIDHRCMGVPEHLTLTVFMDFASVNDRRNDGLVLYTASERRRSHSLQILRILLVCGVFFCWNLVAIIIDSFFSVSS